MNTPINDNDSLKKDEKINNDDILEILNNSQPSETTEDSGTTKKKEENIVTEQNTNTSETSTEDPLNSTDTDNNNDINSLIDSLDLPETKEEVIAETNIQDININSINDILSILLNKKYDFVTFEPNDEQVRLDFRKDKVIVETRYIKYPVYSNILLKAKSYAKLNLEESSEEQEGTQEVTIGSHTLKITVKSVPSNFGEKLFLKAVKIDKQPEKKEVKKISASQIISFIIIALVVGLIVGGSFLAFIVLSAQTVEDVRFFAGLGISLNEINVFISKIVTVVFSALVLIETIGLIICLFKFFLTKKELKKKKLKFGILSAILLIVTFGTATAWIGIDQKIKSLPNWQEMSYGEIQLYDNDKLINDNFDKAGALITDTSNLIGPINIRFDISYLAQSEERKGTTIKSFQWDFGGGDIQESVEPILIKSFNTPGTKRPIVKIIGTDVIGKEIEIINEGIPYINITYIVNIEERVLGSGGKIINFDASSLSELGTVEWYNINDLKNPLFTGFRYINDRPIFEDTIYVMKVKGVDGDIIKLFIIKGESEIDINGEIEYTRGLSNDLDVTFRVTNIKNTQGSGFIEKYIWKIGTQNYTVNGTIDNPEKSSELKHTFTSYGEQEITVELVNSAGENKILTTTIDLSKTLKVSDSITIYADGEKVESVNYNSALNEYFVNNLGVPNIMRFDGRYVKPDSALYVLDNIVWDFNSDGDMDFTGKIGEYPMNSEGNYTVTAYITFVNRRKADEKIEVEQKIFIEAVRKEAVIDFQIKADSEYVPATVSLDGSKSQVAGANIIRFTWSYGDGVVEERDAVVPGHRYVEAGDYIIKLTVTTQDGKSFSKEKTLVLKPAPQSVKIKTSMKRAPIGQGIDFISSDSEGQIANYFWDFGDGEISTQANPTHAYKEAGKYKVKLRLEFTNRNVLEEFTEIEIY